MRQMTNSVDVNNLINSLYIIYYVDILTFILFVYYIVRQQNYELTKTI